MSTGSRFWRRCLPLVSCCLPRRGRKLSRQTKPVFCAGHERPDATGRNCADCTKCERTGERRTDGTCPAAEAASPVAPTPPTTGAMLSLPRDLSPWGMFMAADIVVKTVMVGLAFASVLTWTIWFAKAIELLIVRRRMQATIEALSQARSWNEATSRIKGADSDLRPSSVRPMPSYDCPQMRSRRPA